MAIPFDPEIGTSGYVDTVLSRVVYENIPAVVIRERENCEWCGMMPVKEFYDKLYSAKGIDKAKQ